MSHCEGGDINWGDTAWILCATTFVMLQTPATGLAQAGLVKSKNALSLISQSLIGVAIGSALWFIVGFTLTFGPSMKGVLGTGKYSLLLNVPATDCLSIAPTIPGLLFVSYQMMFALMVWPFLVYYFIAHWVWNENGWLNKLGVKDFAGGITIHTTSGVASFCVSLVQASRKKFTNPAPPHNVPLTIIGAFIIWGGWYSFNGGSALRANFQAVNALLNTQLSACTSLIVWTALGWYETRKYSVVTMASGALAGLAGVTPASGYINAQSAFVIGLIVGVISFYAGRLLKSKLKLDDALDVTALQAVPGIVGSIIVGFTSEASRYPSGGVDGLIYGGGGRLLGVQILGVVITVSWTMFWTMALLKVMEKTIGINISVELESEGLDKSEHGETAYSHMEISQGHDQDDLISHLCEAAARGNLKDVTKWLSLGAKSWQADYDGRTPIHLAASEGHLHVLRTLAKDSGVDLNAEDRWGGTPLSDAVRSGHDHIIAWLKAKGARLKSDQLSSMMCQAAASGELDHLRRLVDSGADVNAADYDNRTALHLAAAEGYVEIVDFLLSRGADPTLKDRWGATPLQDAMRNKHEAVTSLFKAEENAQKELGNIEKYANSEEDILLQVDDSEGKKAAIALSTRELCTAAAAGDLREVKRLVKKGAKPTAADYDGRSPLHLSAAGGHKEVVKYLTELPKVNINCMDRWHNTPYMEAVRYGHEDVAKLLRKKGATSINSQAGPALCAAAYAGNLEELKRMKALGADINSGDYDARTAIHLAAAEGHIEVLQWLIQEGANVNSTDRWGGTPLSDARRHGKQKAKEILLLHGAGEDSLALEVQ